MSQPVSTKEYREQEASQLDSLQARVERLQAELEEARGRPDRKSLADTRQSITHKFSISGHEGYITVGLYPDGRPGEMFVKIAKHGSTTSGLFDTIAVLTSMSLQYGVPVDVLSRKFEHTRFEPCGLTKNPEIRHVNSIVDYVFQWLGTQFSETYRENHRKANLSPDPEQSKFASA